MRRWIVGLFAVLGLAACAPTQYEFDPNPAAQTKPGITALKSVQKADIDHPVILISIDGFRSDYLDRGITPNLSGLADGGVRAAMRPSFPSLTFPNHYTLVTGLRPDHHGIINNTMTDPERPGVTFKLSDRTQVTDAFWWNDGTPFWVSAEKAGIRTATMFWPGSEADIHGVRPSQWAVFDQKKTGEDRVAQILNWVDLPPEQRPTAMTLYFDLVDTQGHEFGPDSSELNEAVKQVDGQVGILLAELKSRGLEDKVTIIVVADHGMAAISAERTVFMDAIIPKDSYFWFTRGSVMGLNATPGHEAEVEAALVGAHDHFTCYKKGQFPENLHYGTHRRVPNITCVAEDGWLIGSDPTKGTGYSGGAHGFDPYNKSMAAIFIAKGPMFESGHRLEPFDNVDVYELLMHLLGLTPEPNDGTLATFDRTALQAQYDN